MKERERLLVLCCHGVYHRGRFYAERSQEQSVYENHIRASFDALKKEQYDVLIISGGYTKTEVEKSEARGYLDWADDLGLDGAEFIILLEECARSSVENLLFSMCRFYQYFGYFPKEVGACTLSWKDIWFEKVIAESLRLSDFHTLKINGEEASLRKIEGAIFPNRKEVTEKNKSDPLERLSAQKVLRRDPWKKGNPYEGIPELREVFEVLNRMEKEGNPSLPQSFKFLWEK
jgi:hypothetical protein